MQDSRLKELAKGFDANRMVVARSMRELRDQNPSAFLAASIAVLRETPFSPGAKFLLAQMLAQPGGMDLLCDPEVFSSIESVALVHEAKSLDSQFEVKLAKLLLSGPIDSEKQANFATRVLDVLDRGADQGTLLPALRQLLRCDNPRVRSKAALLIGRISRNPQWAKLADPAQDQRVVANAIESLWGLDTNAAKTAFAEAAQDSRNRVAGNGALGLYHAGDLSGATILFEFARRRQTAFRATAAWSMGHTGDPRFLDALGTLGADSDPIVQQAARKAQTVISTRLDGLKQKPTIPVQIRTAKWHADEHSMQVMVHDGGPATQKLGPLRFIIRAGATVVERFIFSELHHGGPVLYEIGWHGPKSENATVKVQVVTDEGLGEDTGLELSF